MAHSSWGHSPLRHLTRISCSGVDCRLGRFSSAERASLVLSPLRPDHPRPFSACHTPGSGRFRPRGPHAVPPLRHYSTRNTFEAWEEIPQSLVQSLIPEEAHMLNVDKGPYGYFPMQLGQYLHKRELQVVRKLGVGGFSSVWLAKQSIKNEAGYRYLALKVLTTYAILVERKRRMHDIEMAWKMSRLPPSARKHPGYKHCSVPLFDVFSEESAHGLHYGIPSSVCSGSVYSLFRETSRHRGLPLGVAKRITKQVLMALDFLHTTLGVVHGDVHPGNVLLRLRASTSDIDQYLFLHPAETYEPMHLPMLSPQPFVTVRSQPLPLLGVDPSLCNLDVQLTDYGLAVRADTITPGTAPLINMHMRAPEQLLGLRWGQPLDVWEAGIMVLALLTQGGPFQPSEDVQTCLASMHALLGPFPAEFLRRCRDDGSKSMPIDKHAMFLLTRPPENPVPLEYWLAAVLDSPMSARDIADSSRFVRRCLAIDPTARPTTAELLEDPWLAT